jgi:hypothetical protein
MSDSGRGKAVDNTARLITIILSEYIVITKILGTCGYVQLIFQTGFISP